MGHITADRLKDAWKKLNKAERLATKDQTHAAVLECENALDEVFRSADGMGMGVWFSGKEDSVRTRIGNLKLDTAPPEEEVLDLINECKELTKESKEHIIPELHSRIDYEVSVPLDE